ncbi:MAG: hypothetical protein RIR70_1640 [Pseudomonadota bacterium]|jgi:hypothetical protein
MAARYQVVCNPGPLWTLGVLARKLLRNRLAIINTLRAQAKSKT